MKSKKIIAAALAIAMMVTSIQLPPVQISAEEAMVQSANDKDIPVSVLSAKELKDLMRAMYVYYQKAAEYRSNQST